MRLQSDTERMHNKEKRAYKLRMWHSSLCTISAPSKEMATEAKPEANRRTRFSRTIWIIFWENSSSFSPQKSTEGSVKSYVQWNLTWHEILGALKSYVTWNLTWREILRDMKSYVGDHLRPAGVCAGIAMAGNFFLPLTTAKMLTWSQIIFQKFPLA